jgi:hypothetical protein
VQWTLALQGSHIVDRKIHGEIRGLGMKLALVLALVMAMSFTAGCAAFRAGRVERISDWPPQTAVAGPSIRLVPTGVIRQGRRQGSWHRGEFASWAATLRKAYESSGYFSEVRFQPAETDLVADVRIFNQGSDTAFLGTLSGLTLGIIPAWGKDEIQVTTTFTNAQGRTLGTIEKSEDVTIWIHLFMVFAMPGRSPPLQVLEDVKQDLFRSTVIEAHSMGFFDPLEASP